MRRLLTPSEIAEARKVFGNSLDYQQVEVFENWPRLWLVRRRRLAFGIGNSARFYRKIQTNIAKDMAWLIHELTHVWQFQKQGWVYFPKALLSRGFGRDPYDYGSEEGLLKAIKLGKSIHDFNPEQQGEITRDYYLIMAETGKIPKAWKYFIEEIRRS